MQAARSVSQPHSYDSTPGSPARVECDAHPSLTTPPSCLADAYRHGVMLLVSAEDHALGLADLLRARRPFACYTVARALAEASARAFDLLEPEAGAEERLRRLWNEALWGMYEYTAFMNGRQPDDAASRELSGFTPKLRAVGVEITWPRRGAPYVGRRRPGVATLLDRLVARETAGASAGLAFGQVFHALSSAVSHGAGHGFVHLLEFQPDQTGAIAQVARPSDLTAESAAEHLVTAPIAFATVYRLAARQMGWETAPLDAAARRLLAAWSAALP